MKFSKDEIIQYIKKIRKEIGHKNSEINIKELLFTDEKNELWIVTLDRPDKSAIIGKGGWVVGKLKEMLNLNKIHVYSYSDYILKKYQMELSLKSLNSFISNYPRKTKSLNNLKILLEEKIANIYNFDINSYFKNRKITEERDHQAIVALSGGVDSSFSLILAKYLGFNPIAITIDPGTIILPNQFKHNIKKLSNKLNVQHQFIEVDYGDIIKDSLTGKFHPCGRCSNNTETTLFKFAAEKNIDIVIFGDMLSTGTQCITKTDVNPDFNDMLSTGTQCITKTDIASDPNDTLSIAKQTINNKDTIIKNDEKGTKSIARLNLPATLSIGKEEIKNLVDSYNLLSIKGFGCPLLYEVHKKHPHMKKFSIQRILRETRSAALEPGEALDLIWSFYKL